MTYRYSLVSRQGFEFAVVATNPTICPARGSAYSAGMPHVFAIVDDDRPSWSECPYCGLERTEVLEPEVAALRVGVVERDREPTAEEERENVLFLEHIDALGCDEVRRSQ